MSVAEENRPASPAPKARLLIRLTGVLWSLAGVVIKSFDFHPRTQLVDALIVSRRKNLMS